MKGHRKRKFFDMEIYIENTISGSQYRIDNFLPILFMKYIPYKLGVKPINF